MVSRAAFRQACQRTAFAAAVLALTCAPAAAQEYQKPFFRYGISETAIWDSNPLMLRENASSVFGAQTQAYFGFQKKGPASNAEGDFILRRSDFDQSEYSSTDFNARTDLSKNLARWLLAFKGRYDYDTTRNSELTTFGRDVGMGRRKSFDLMPSAIYSVTARSGLGLSGKWQETRYDTDNLVDYRLTSLSPLYTYKLSPLQTVSLTFQAQRFALLEDSDRHIDSLGPSLGWSYNVAPAWTVDLSIGTLASKVSGFSGSDTGWENSLIYGGALRYAGLRHEISLSAVRSRQPYANGTESLLTTFEAKERYRANERLDIELEADYSFADETPVATSNLDTVWSGQAGLRYALGSRWSADASYRYRAEEVSNANGRADQQMVRVGITYKFGSLEK